MNTVMPVAVTIYTTNTCVYCSMAKDYFKKHDVKYTEINVEKSPEAAEEMIEKSGQMGVPVIDINGKIIVGFNRPEIEKALKK